LRGKGLIAYYYDKGGEGRWPFAGREKNSGKNLNRSQEISAAPWLSSPKMGKNLFL